MTISRHLFEKLKGFFASTEFQNEWSSYVIKDNPRAMKLFKGLLSVATDGRDGNELKQERMVLS